MKLLKIAFLITVTTALVLAQAPKPRPAETKGAVTLQVSEVIDSTGHWHAKLWITSPNTDTFKICFRYFDGVTTRSLVKTAIADVPNQPATFVLEVPLETFVSGSLYVYELVPITVVDFDAH